MRPSDRMVGNLGPSVTTTLASGKATGPQSEGVAVLPAHRRRGSHDRSGSEDPAECSDQKEPLATLWASRAVISGRFCFGVAMRHCDLKITPDGHVRRVKLARATSSAVYRPKKPSSAHGLSLR